MPDEEKPKKKRGKLFKILILLVLLGGIGFAVWKFLLPMVLDSDSSAEPQAVEQAQSAEEAASLENVVVPLPTFMVNLSDPLGRRYIKLTVEVEVNSEQAAEELLNSTAKVRDAINLLLSSKSYADLAPAENKIMLKNEIVERLNQILGGPKVARVYFAEIVIQ
ncbi:MAG: flagellar basal body-associated FliL family protein [Desulfovibrionaceae bacterium]|nr:flagellar basal body-associated FliL family protein [Desulfovibrionaceae bacterium]